MKEKFKLSLKTQLCIMHIVPLLLVVVIMFISAMTIMRRSMEDETNRILDAALKSLENDMLNTNYSSEELNSRLDLLKDDGIEFTVFSGDIRVATSIISNGERAVGTTASADIYTLVVNNKQTVYRSGVDILGTDYYVCYIPFTYNGEAGMLFAGTPQTNVEEAIASLGNKLFLYSSMLILVALALGLWISIATSKAIKKSSDTLAILANGRLEMPVESRALTREVSSLNDSISTLVVNLRDVISTISKVSIELSQQSEELSQRMIVAGDATEQINYAMEELAKASTQMAQDVQETAVNTDNVDNEMRVLTQTASSLNSVYDDVSRISTEARGEVETVHATSKDVIQDVQDIVGSIQEAMKEVAAIDDVVSSIMDIASQTNLLSLNASIEAARAGDAGRGFSVVASSIQGLAQMSSEQARSAQSTAKRITDMIQQCCDKAEIVVKSVDDETVAISSTVTRFSKLDERISTMQKAVTDIHNVVISLEGIVGGLHNNVADLSAISEEDAASAEEVSANTQGVSDSIQTVLDLAKNVSEHVNNLNNAIAVFEL